MSLCRFAIWRQLLLPILFSPFSSYLFHILWRNSLTFVISAFTDRWRQSIFSNLSSLYADRWDDDALILCLLHSSYLSPSPDRWRSLRYATPDDAFDSVGVDVAARRRHQREMRFGRRFEGSRGESRLQLSRPSSRRRGENRRTGFRFWGPCSAVWCVVERCNAVGH